MGQHMEAMHPCNTHARRRGKDRPIQDLQKLFEEIEEEEWFSFSDGKKNKKKKKVKETLSKIRDTLAVISKDNSKQKRDISGPQIVDMFGIEAEIGSDVLEGKPIFRECLMNLILFPKAQGICVTALIDMWAEL